MVYFIQWNRITHQWNGSIKRQKSIYLSGSFYQLLFCVKLPRTNRLKVAALLFSFISDYISFTYPLKEAFKNTHKNLRYRAQCFCIEKYRVKASWLRSNDWHIQKQQQKISYNLWAWCNADEKYHLHFAYGF